MKKMLKKVKKIVALMMATMALSTLFVTTAFAQENDVQLPTKQRYHWEARNNAKLGIHFASLHPVSIK
jgi:hypothetical protein